MYVSVLVTVITEILTVLGQGALPESCPVCAHSPLDAALCKPNKALRTTLKAFLRTEEKKRERERPSSKPVDSPTPAPAPAPVPTETPTEESTPVVEPQKANGVSEQQTTQQPENNAPVDGAVEEKAEPALAESSTVDPATQNETPTIEPVSFQDAGTVDRSESNESPQHDTTNSNAENTETAAEDQPNPSEELPQPPSEQAPTTEGDDNTAQDAPQTDQSLPNGMGMDPNNPTALQPMGWQGPMDVNQMMPFMANGMPVGGMMPFPNQMGKSSFIDTRGFLNVHMLTVSRSTRHAWNGNRSNGCISGNVYGIRNEYEWHEW